MEQLCIQTEKTIEMLWGEAKGYVRALERKLEEVLEVIAEAEDFYKITETHLRKRYNPEAEDEVIVRVKKNTLNAEPMDVIGYMEDLIAEKEKMKKLLNEKSRYSQGLNAEKVRSVLKLLVSVNEVTEEEEMRTDYKLNAKGEQVAYKYKVKGKAELEYTHKEILDELKKFNRKIAEYERKNRLHEEITEEIHFVPKYDAENTLADDLEVFLLNK